MRGPRRNGGAGTARPALSRSPPTPWPRSAQNYPDSSTSSTVRHSTGGVKDAAAEPREQLVLQGQIYEGMPPTCGDVRETEPSRACDLRLYPRSSCSVPVVLGPRAYPGRNLNEQVLILLGVLGALAAVTCVFAYLTCAEVRYRTPARTLEGNGARLRGDGCCADRAPPRRWVATQPPPVAAPGCRSQQNNQLCRRASRIP